MNWFKWHCHANDADALLQSHNNSEEGSEKLAKTEPKQMIDWLIDWSLKTYVWPINTLRHCTRYRNDVVKFENPRYRCTNNSCRYSKGNTLYVGPTVFI